MFGLGSEAVADVTCRVRIHKAQGEVCGTVDGVLCLDSMR